MTHSKHAYRNSAAALALAATMIAALPAQAEQANVKSMSFNAVGDHAMLRVISTDGVKWDKLKNGSVAFSGHMKVDTRWPGYVGEVGIVLGTCGPGQCSSFPRVWSGIADSRDYDHTAIVGFNSALIPFSSGGGIAVVPFGDRILAKCNQHLQPDGPTKSYSFTETFDATFTAETDKILDMGNTVYEAKPGSWPYAVDGDHTAHGSFEVQVTCDPVFKPSVGDLATDFGAFDVEDVKLFLTTYQSNQPGSNPATVCPALKVTSRAETNQAGPVTMKIWRQKDGGPITADVQQAWASFDAVKNGYFATYETFETVGTTSYFQFKTEIIDGTVFPPEDGWKDITVHCTGAGGGGLAPQPQDNDDLPKPQAKWQGQIIVADSAGSRKACPRKGQVSFSVSRQAPGDFGYRISCSNGAYFAGTATGFDVGNGSFQAQAAHDISVNKTRSISCTLQELTPAPVTVDMDKEDFTCANPNFDPAADDIVSSTQPPTHKPVVPPVVVDPGRKCMPSQMMVRGKCIDRPVVAACGLNEKLISGKCRKVPGVSIFCKPGYIQKGKECVRKPVIADPCRSTQIRVNGKCVAKPVISILCKPGFILKGKTCVRKPMISVACKRGETMVRGHCIARPPVNHLGARTFKQGDRKVVLPKARKMRRIN